VFFLNVFPIHCTPLRERSDDIPLLAAHFLDLVCRRSNRTPPIITAGTIRTLQQYDWPGNVQELANVIERGAIVSRADKFLVDIHPVSAPAVRKAMTLLSEADVAQIRVANTIACLQETKGRVSGPKGAAALLGVRPTTLYSRIKTLGLTAED
jgi:DNA-binding NtrC family response regulator